jgi:hypothetical protein
MPRVVRKQPLSERIAAYLNPYDFLLWLSEEVESRGFDQLEKEWAIPLGFFFNLFFVIARANTQTRSRSYDDVFGSTSGYGWRAWLVSQPRSEGQRRAELIITVHTRSALSDFGGRRQRCLHLLEAEALPTIRKRHRQCPQYSISAPSSRGRSVVPNGIISVAFAFYHIESRACPRASTS